MELLSTRLEKAFTNEILFKKLSITPEELPQLMAPSNLADLAAPLLPVTSRFSCAQVLEAFRPVLDQIAPEPEEGWLTFAYHRAVEFLYPQVDEAHTAAQRDAAVCYLQFLQILMDEERDQLPFDPWLDFAFCTDTELENSDLADEYRRFLMRFRNEYVYELLRLGQEVTPFHTLEHIAGVHHVAMTVGRAFHAGGGLIDLALMSGAAAGHDIGKFGCKPGERVPYLHYFYTDQWFSWRKLPSLGRIASNHSVWDLEIENLSSESLILVYSDFRVKQSRGEDGQEITHLFSLKDAFDVILSKLDNVDEAKRLRYQYVYAKLVDFEEYLAFFGVDTTLETTGGPPTPRKDAALMTTKEVVHALRHTAVDHNIRLMHRLGHEQLFAGILEAARGEKEPARIRAYVSIFEEYFTYWSASQKEQTLEFLYELLLSTDGDIRRQAAVLMGRILAKFLSGYKKELPAGTAPSPQESRPFELWRDYLEKLIHPDHRLTPRQTSMIRYQAKTVADSLLENCSAADTPHFADLLFRHYQSPEQTDPDAAFALLDTVLNIPADRMDSLELQHLVGFAVWWLEHGDAPQKAAALRLFGHLLETMPADAPQRQTISDAVEHADCSGVTPLLYLQSTLGRHLGLPSAESWATLDQSDAISSVFLDNLKTATPWILKAIGVDYLLHQAVNNPHTNTLHIATHFSNLIKVSENVVVRRMAGERLLAVAPMLTPEHRNEVTVELSKALETGQAEISQYIPEYLGRFGLWLPPRELDEMIDHMMVLLSSSHASVVSAVLSTLGSMLEHYAEYTGRFRESSQAQTARRRRIAGLLLKGLASCQESIRQETLRILGEGLFASTILSYDDKTDLFVLLAKKILFLINEQTEEELTFFYTASALSHIYRFIVHHRIVSGPFQFRIRDKVAFFPGTFDPFSLSHKGIVEEIRNLGFEVHLAIDEFSWSKKAQPSLVRRQIVSMSVADMFDVYLFPHDIPVNLATPADLIHLREVFADRELYLTVGSDVVANASSYKIPPVEGSVHSLNHIVFRRSSDAEGHEIDADLSCITGNILSLQLPTHLEDISSTRIRENIDLGRDISNLIDPTVQDFIFRNSLYLREPQYKQIIRAGYLEFVVLDHPTPSDWANLYEAVPGGPDPDLRDSVYILRETSGEKPRTLGYLTMRTITSSDLYDTLGDQALANYVRVHTAGHIRLLTGMRIFRLPRSNYDVGQLLLTEALSRAMADDCGYAVWWSPSPPEDTLDLLTRQGFVQAEIETPRPLLLVDMRSPVVLLQNIPTTLKEPFSSDRKVLAAIRNAHFRLQHAICHMYPGTLVLSLNAEVIYHRLVQKITARNGVPTEPTKPRVLGPKMCVPFGKILRGNAVPNTVTKTIHTDKVFASDLHSFTIERYPGYAPLESQIRTVRSFRRPVILIDDLLHSGNRLKVLDPLFRQEDVTIDQVIVGLLSGRGKDLMAAKNMDVDCVYYVPNMQAWFVESTMYPFIGGDTVSDATSSVPGLIPAVNLILPYAFPRFYKQCGHAAVFDFSITCLQNSRDILKAIANSYKERYARNLTLSRLSEAVILPLSPDKGSMRYDPNLAADVCLENDIKLLLRMQNLLE